MNYNFKGSIFYVTSKSIANVVSFTSSGLSFNKSSPKTTLAFSVWHGLSVPLA